jgi:hypothetical protein
MAASRELSVDRESVLSQRSESSKGVSSSPCYKSVTRRHLVESSVLYRRL